VRHTPSPDNIERYSDTTIKPATKLVSIGATHLYIKANYQDFQRFAEVDLVIPADAEATLPYLIVLMGVSAGGGLAFATMLRLRDEGVELPGVTDLNDLIIVPPNLRHRATAFPLSLARKAVPPPF
jgi:hypothetical protein